MDNLSQEPLLDYSQTEVESSEEEGTVMLTTAGGSLAEFNDSRTTAILFISCLVVAVLAIKVFRVYFLKLVTLSTTATAVFSFAVNILVGVVTDSMGFIHSTSLRWALYRERCTLRYNQTHEYKV
ncbi:hypothetical protein EG329_000711 [Mollisiaceae sp. DMI_Dod_QoI]|nr:hypothetical protein EG329_000711 [Helotiales sp. DMI_Dod_QoI]